MAPSCSERPGPGRGRVDGEVEPDLANALAHPHPRPAGVDEDAPQPGVEPLRVAQAGQLAPGRDEGVLGGVARLGLVAQHRPRDAERPVGPGREEALEGERIAPGGAADEIDLARDGQLWAVMNSAES